MKTNRITSKFLSRNIAPISIYVAAIAATLIFPLHIKENYVSAQVAAVAVSTSLFLGYLNYQHTQDRLFKDLFKEFNERYNVLGEEFQKLEESYAADVKLADIKKQDLKSIIAYLNLCAEEFFWNEKGRIDDGAWDSWKSGMETWAKLSAVKVVFEDEVSTWKASYYEGFQTFFRAML